jgi:hypothetical protein
LRELAPQSFGKPQGSVPLVKGMANANQKLAHRVIADRAIG